MKKIDLHKITPPICLKCGYPYPVEIEECALCKNKSFTSLRSLFMYEGLIRENILQYKLRGDLLSLTFLNTLIKKVFSFNLDVDLLVPVPTDILSYFKRCTNPALDICKNISKLSSIPYDSPIGKKITFIKQKNLTQIARKHSKKKFFMKDNSSITNKRILVVDDVATSLSTLDSISTLLLQHGALSVDCFSLARTTKTLT